jgi:hypothetical protein
MGCVVCNIVRDHRHRLTSSVDEIKEELCYDIAVHHPEMVQRINDLVAMR